MKVIQSCPTLYDPMDYTVHGILQARILESGSRSLLQEICPTQEWNPGLPHCRWTIYQLSHQETPSILEWVAIPFSRGTSKVRDRTQVSHIADVFFTSSEPAGKPMKNTKLYISCRPNLRV